MRAYSMDLRERVLHDSDAGMQAAAVASRDQRARHDNPLTLHSVPPPNPSGDASLFALIHPSQYYFDTGCWSGDSQRRWSLQFLDGWICAVEQTSKKDVDGRKSRMNRDRGEPRGSAPPTPPCIRVRTRRFGWMSVHRASNLGSPSESK